MSGYIPEDRKNSSAIYEIYKSYLTLLRSIKYSFVSFLFAPIWELVPLFGAQG
jgi:hypothetical protein